MKKVLFVLILSFFFISSINAQQGKMHAGGQVGISLPMGDFGDGANLGFGFLGNFLYGITPAIDLTGSIGYYTWGSDADNVSFSDVPLLFGGRYYFNRSEFTPYGLAQLGLHFRSFEVEAITTPFGTFGGGSTSDSEFGINLGGGFLYNMGSLMLDVNGSINIISDQNHITIMAGVLFPIQ